MLGYEALPQQQGRVVMFNFATKACCTYNLVLQGDALVGLEGCLGV